MNDYYHFTGKEKIVIQSIFPKIKNNFTYEFFVKPSAPITIKKESTTGVAGTLGQKYIIGAENCLDAACAGVGLSVGTNGIVVVEHSVNYLPITLSLAVPINNWIHIAITYDEKRPKLYINGVLRKVGLVSPKESVYASGIIGGLSPYGFFQGYIRQFRLWDHPLAPETIAQKMEKKIEAKDNGLIVNYQFNEKSTLILDRTGHQHHGYIYGQMKKTAETAVKKIGVIMSSSSYSATRFFATALSKAFEQLGYDLIMIDLTKPDYNKKIETILRDKNLYFLFGMNAHGYEYLKQRINGLQVPFFCYLVDHPIYHQNRLDYNLKAENLIVSCLDRTHVDYLNNYYKGTFTKAFIPHGASLGNISEIPANSLNKRNTDILFTGTYTDPVKHRNVWLQDHEYKTMIDEIVEKSLYESNIPLIDVAEVVLHSKGKRLTPDRRFTNLLVHADYYIRGYRRKKVLESFKHLSLMIFNTDWQYLKNKNGRIQIYPSIDYLEFQYKLQHAKMILNILPNLSYGGHDRIFTAMLTGGVSLTDKNKFLESNFTHGENILFYDLDDPNLEEKVVSYLQDVDMLERIALKGREIAKKNHTWEQRAKSILNVIKLHYDKN